MSEQNPTPQELSLFMLKNKLLSDFTGIALSSLSSILRDLVAQNNHVIFVEKILGSTEETPSVILENMQSGFFSEAEKNDTLNMVLTAFEKATHTLRTKTYPDLTSVLALRYEHSVITQEILQKFFENILNSLIILHSAASSFTTNIKTNIDKSKHLILEEVHPSIETAIKESIIDLFGGVNDNLKSTAETLLKDDVEFTEKDLTDLLK